MFRAFDSDGGGVVVNIILESVVVDILIIEGRGGFDGDIIVVVVVVVSLGRRGGRFGEVEVRDVAQLLREGDEARDDLGGVLAIEGVDVEGRDAGLLTGVEELLKIFPPPLVRDVRRVVGDHDDAKGLGREVTEGDAVGETLRQGRALELATHDVFDPPPKLRRIHPKLMVLSRRAAEKQTNKQTNNRVPQRKVKSLKLRRFSIN